MKRPRRDTICAIIVTYYPDEAFASRISGVHHQVGDLVIVDNGSDPPAVDMLKAIPTRGTTHLILNHDNAGIASALNQGVEWAMEHGYDWVLLLDQDTEPTDDMVESLTAVFDGFPEREQLSVIGSNYYHLDPQQPEYTLGSSDGNTWVRRRSVITSGSLVSLEILSQIGPFRDEFFIDHVDDEYCFRARKNGFKVVMTRAPLMKHAIGTRRRHRLPGHTAETSNHAPLRRYYMSRNYVVMAREYLFREPGWVLWKLYKLFKSVILIAAFERDRATKLRHILRGTWHGVRGKLGRLGDRSS